MSDDADEQLSRRVIDPEDFNRKQRFKEIHDARQRVTDFITEMELAKRANQYSTIESKRLSYLVALYITELEPLIHQSELEHGDLYPDGLPFDSLVEFASVMGINSRSDGSDFLSPQALLRVFSAANRFYARVGMDLELEEEDGDAGFDYTDILEEGPPSNGEAPQIKPDGGDMDGGDE